MFSRLVLPMLQRISTPVSVRRRQGVEKEDQNGPARGEEKTAVTGKTFYFEDLAVGMEASITHQVTEADIVSFADISGDRNPVHLDAEYAAGTMFKERIAHGLLTASYISAVFGMEMPGPGAIYISQTLNFKAPVVIGDEVISKATVVELFPAKRRALFDCVCLVRDKPVLDGEAMLMVPSRPKA